MSDPAPVGAVGWNASQETNSGSQLFPTAQTQIGPEFYSHVFNVKDAPMVVRAYGLGADEQVCVDMVLGDGAGVVFERLYINGNSSCLYPGNTTIVIPYEGKYRAVMIGVAPEDFNDRYVTVIQSSIPFNVGLKGDKGDTGIRSLPTIATLENRTGSATLGDAILVRDHLSGGVFVYDPTATVDGGTVFEDASHNIWRRLYSGAPYASWWGAVGNGVTSDDAAWDAIIALGIEVQCIPTANYVLTAGKLFTSGTKIIGNGCRFSVKVGTVGPCFKSVNFNDRGTLAATVFLLNGCEDVVLRDFSVRQLGLTQVVLNLLWCDAGFAASQLQIINVDCVGLTPSGCVTINSIGVGSYILTNFDVTGGTFSNGHTYWLPALALPQPGVVVLDDNIIGGVGSKRGFINGLKVKDFLFSGDALLDYGPQTDAFTAVNILTEAPVVTPGIIDGVGEGVDCAARGGSGDWGIIRNCTNFDFCYKNGGSDNTYAFSPGAAGNAAVCISGATAATHTQNNTVTLRGLVQDIGSIGVASDTAVVKFFQSGGLGHAKNNTIFLEGGVAGDAGGNLDWVVYSGIVSDGTGNAVKVRGRATGYALGYGNENLTDAQFVRVEHEDEVGTRLGIAAPQVLAAGVDVETVINFNTVRFDLAGEADTASNTVRAKHPKLRRLHVLYRLSGFAGPSEVLTQIKKNGTVIGYKQEEFNSGTEQGMELACSDYVSPVEAGKVAAYYTATVTTTSGVPLQIFNTPGASFFEVV